LEGKKKHNKWGDKKKKNHEGGDRGTCKTRTIPIVHKEGREAGEVFLGNLGKKTDSRLTTSRRGERKKRNNKGEDEKERESKTA